MSSGAIANGIAGSHSALQGSLVSLLPAELCLAFDDRDVIAFVWQEVLRIPPNAGMSQGWSALRVDRTIHLALGDWLFSKTLLRSIILVLVS